MRGADIRRVRQGDGSLGVGTEAEAEAEGLGRPSF
jgi:hypothetical protein